MQKTAVDALIAPTGSISPHHYNFVDHGVANQQLTTNIANTSIRSNVTFELEQMGNTKNESFMPLGSHQKT